jgi:hypothetical protein
VRATGCFVSAPAGTLVRLAPVRQTAELVHGLPFFVYRAAVELHRASVELRQAAAELRQADPDP